MHNLWLTGYQATEFPYMKNNLYMKFRFHIEKLILHMKFLFHIKFPYMKNTLCINFDFTYEIIYFIYVKLFISRWRLTIFSIFIIHLSFEGPLGLSINTKVVHF